MGVPGEVYILHNCSLREGLLKIGLTTRTAETRARELWTTGIPDKFTVLFSWRVNNAAEIERRLHARFAEFRVSDSREFFQVSPSRAISALLEEAGILVKGLPADHDDADTLPSLISIYGPLLDPGLRAVTIEIGKGLPTSLVCSLNRDGDEVVLRRDLDFVYGENEPYFASATDATAAARLLLTLDPYSLIMVTPLFSERGAQLIADMYERARLDDRAMKAILEDAKTKSAMTTIDLMEVSIRRKLSLPAHKLELVSVHEHDGHFLLSLVKGSKPLYNLRIQPDDDNEDRDPREPVSCAIVTRDFVDELDYFDVIDIGYRDSPATWTSDGPRIRVTGIAPTGVPFEQIFAFLP